MPTGNITVRSTALGILNSSFLGLQVDNQENLLLLGGHITIDGGGSGAGLIASGGRVEVGAVGGTGAVDLNGHGSLSFPEALARADVVLTNNAQIDVSSSGGGDIEITARSIDILDQSKLIAGISNGLGTADSQAGNLRLNAVGEIQIRRSIVANTVDPSTGDAGNVDITTGSLSLSNGSQLTSSNFGQGDAGNVIINARDAVSFDGSAAFSTVEVSGVGQSGDVRITAGSLSLSNGSQLTSSNSGQGDAGNVIINARDTVSFDSSGAIARVNSTGVGRGGDVQVTAGSLSLSNGAQLTISIRGRSDAGSVIINAHDTVSVDGTSADGQISSGVFSGVEATGFGRGGDVRVTAGFLSLSNGALLSASTGGSGNAGDITIQTADTLRLDNSDITTSSNTSSGGAIRISGGDIRLRGDSNIRTQVQQGEGGGGNITVNADSLIAFDDSDIIAAATDGRGGNINFGDTIAFFENFDPNAANADPATLERNDRADVNATGAEPGIISIFDTTFIQNSLSDLPENAVDADSLIANSCIARTETGGTFLVTGSGGLPPRPGVAPLSPYPAGTVRTEVDEQPSSSWQPGDAIVEPQGVYRLPNGELVMSRECAQVRAED